VKPTEVRTHQRIHRFVAFFLPDSTIRLTFATLENRIAAGKLTSDKNAC
jgi:hypothetical protein